MVTKLEKNKVICHVCDIVCLNQYVYKVRLKPLTKISYLAGQHIKLNIDDKIYHFSIASLSEDVFIELHIGGANNTKYFDQIISFFEKHKKEDIPLTTEIPKSNACWRDNKGNPIMLIAGGTGFSYIKPILSKSILHYPHQEIYFFWGVQKADNLYDIEYLKKAKDVNKNINIILVIEKENKVFGNINGQLYNVICCKNVIDAIESEYIDTLKRIDSVYIAGPYAMVQNFKKLHKNLELECTIYGDLI